MKLQRPERYVPLSVRFHTSKTGVDLHKHFGRDGLLVWVCYLAACKSGNPPGAIRYASEAEGWALLGLAHDPPKFTLEEFFTVTGRLKKTRRRRSGRITETICTVWGRWSEEARTEFDRERKSRTRQEKMWDTKRTPPGQDVGHAADLELELELEKTKPTNQANVARPPAPEPAPAPGGPYPGESREEYEERVWQQALANGAGWSKHDPGPGRVDPAAELSKVLGEPGLAGWVENKKGEEA